MCSSFDGVDVVDIRVYVFGESRVVHDCYFDGNALFQVPLSMGLPRQEYWSGLPFPPLGDLPTPGIELASLHSVHWWVYSLPVCHLGSPSLGSKCFKEWAVVASMHSTIGKWKFHGAVKGHWSWSPGFTVLLGMSLTSVIRDKLANLLSGSSSIWCFWQEQERITR